MKTKMLEAGLLGAALIFGAGSAPAQSAGPSAGTAAESPGVGAGSRPGLDGTPGARPGAGMMGRGPHAGSLADGRMMDGRMMDGRMMDGRMMDGRMMGGEGMMGGQGMMGGLPPGNEKLAMRIRGEIMVAVGNVLIKHADSVQPKSSD